MKNPVSLHPGQSAKPRRLRCMIVLAVSLFTWSASAIGWVSRHDLSSSEFQAEFNKWTQAPYHYRLISVDGYEKEGQARYAAVWAQESGPSWAAQHGLTQTQLESLITTYAHSGYKPVFLSTFGIGGNLYFNAIWEETPYSSVIAEVGLLFHDFLAINSQRTSQGYVPMCVWTCDVAGTDYYAAIYRWGGSTDFVLSLRLSASEYQDEFNSLSAAGYQLINVSAAQVSGLPKYTSLWTKPGSGMARFAHHGLTEQNYQAQNWNYQYQGYRPVLASVFNSGKGPRFNAIFQRNGGMTPPNLAVINNAISGYMQSNGIPGLSLAISRNGRLVYAKGWGLADQSANEWVHPHHRFRIASVSKPVTAAAVLKLRDMCGLDLDQTVFGSGAILGQTFGTAPYSARERAITVRQLLHHTSGWTNDGIWRVTSDDPADAIDWQLDNALGEPMTFPGNRYTYMNIGFCVAGRVIERISGRSYEQFVQQELLAPSCVTEMEIGGRTLMDRKPNEVVYYQSSSRNPYDLSPSRMDAHGGWIAKPMDLLSLLRRIDSNTNNAELLQSDSLTAMRTTTLTPGPSGGGTNYGLGLGVGANGWGHNGAMNGTLADLSYRNDGLAFAVTCNTWPNSDQFAGVIKATINNVINTLDAAGAWPNYDLFDCDIPPGNPPLTMEVTKDIYVDGSCNSLIGNGQQGCNALLGPYHTVAEGVEAVCAGDRLWIRTGFYPEAVLFDRRVTVRAYDGTAVVGE